MQAREPGEGAEGKDHAGGFGEEIELEGGSILG